MASVAICPFCNAQLAVPGEMSGDARGQCPACRQQFDLAQAELRSLPEIVPVTRPASATTVAEIFPADNERIEDESTERADADFAKWFASDKTVVDAPAVAAATEPDETTPPATEPAESPRKSSAVTLADLLPPRPEPSDEPPPGPTFDLPNVPLVRENSATVEFEAATLPGNGANTEFELDDVDFEAPPAPAASRDEPFANEPDFARTAAEDVPPIAARPAPRKPQRRVLRTLVGAASGGLFGLAAGYYVLLLLLGPGGDFLQLARFVPRQVLPASFAEATASRTVVADEPAQTPPVNIQASHAEPINLPTASDDVTTEPEPQEPARLDEMPAAPLPASPRAAAPPVRAIAGPEYDADDLFAALRAAEKALPGLVTGELSDPAFRRTKGQSYEKFCNLAHAVTFSNAADDTSTRLANEASQLFGDALGDSHTRGEVARIAEIWIDYPNRRHGGVLLVGTLGGGQIAGDVYEYQLNTPNGGTLTLVAAQPIDAALDAHASTAVAGTIVQRPADEIAGYTGTAERAIWVGRVIALP